MKMMSNEGEDGTHEPRRNYSPDVFISYSMNDRSSSRFTRELYHALKENEIAVFMDDQNLQDGDQLSPSVLEAIQESWISIVVLSHNYPFSSNCLNQLVKIVECSQTQNHVIYPIFYQVNPSDVRKLTGYYGEAMDRHANRFGSDSSMMQKWVSALKLVANIAGWVYRNGAGNEHDFLQRVVGFVALRAIRHDVFLSFRGDDTGYTFTGNLYNALRQKKIKAFFFKDDNNYGWYPGFELPHFIRKAIGDARISIVVLSKNYASSTPCLEELANIIECMKMKNQRVWPIFYKVEPSDVRKQKGDYGDAMDSHKNFFGNDSEEVKNWSSALFEVSNLTGFPFQSGYEYELIQRIVESTVGSLPRYDVFLSYSGEDTRHTFSGYLYNVLRQKGFKIFMDDEALVDGNQISQTLTKIEISRHSVIVFSENYAYSSWCLDELVKIHECMMMKKNIVVWPIFYKVEPSDVRYQRNSYGDAISAHENMFGKNSDKVQKWRLALSEVPYLGGYYRRSESEIIFKELEHENELIEQIVEHLSFSYSKVSDPTQLPSTGGFKIGLDR